MDTSRSRSRRRASSAYTSDIPNTWWQWVLVVAIVIVMLTGITFAVGVRNFYANAPINNLNSTVTNSTTPGTDSDDSNSSNQACSLKLKNLLEDTTFFILISQLCPVLLNTYFEFAKIGYGQHSWGSQAIFLTAHSLAACFAISAAAVYGALMKRPSAWPEVVTMTLSAVASLAVIIAGMISVFDAGHEREGIHREASNEAFQNRIDALEAENQRLRTRLRKPWKMFSRSSV